MIIVLEGPDGGGKSTLAERVSGLPKVEHVSMLLGRTQPQATSRANVYRVLRENVGKTVICERFHAISDPIYRDLDGGPRIFSRYEEGQLSAELAKQRALIIYCRPPIASALLAEQTGKDDTEEWVRFTRENMDRLYRGYDLAMVRLSKLGAGVVHYDYTSPWAEDVLREALPCAA